MLPGVSFFFLSEAGFVHESTTEITGYNTMYELFDQFNGQRFTVFYAQSGQSPDFKTKEWALATLKDASFTYLWRISIP